jgi:hypothetical protein
VKPKRCKDCPHFNNAGHPKDSPYGKSKYQAWCCHYGTVAKKAVSICIQQKYKESICDTKMLNG